MTARDKLDEREIRITSIASEVPPGMTGKAADWAKLTFKIGALGPDYPVYVDRRNVADEHLVRVARHYLHMQTHRLGESTVSWRLSEEEYKQLLTPPKSPPSKSLAERLP
ncbi:MAG: hypothetical protein ACLQME_02500 [Alphaproteobacteria bacterium]